MPSLDMRKSFSSMTFSYGTIDSIGVPRGLPLLAIVAASWFLYVYLTSLTELLEVVTKLYYKLLPRGTLE